MTNVQPNRMSETSSEGATSHPRLNPSNVPPSLVSKVYEMVDDPSTDAIISWGPDGKGLVILDQKSLSETLLPKYFKHNNLLSFIRQLNHYGFRKVADRTRLRRNPNIMEYTNDHFARGQPHLLKNITYKKKKAPDTQYQPQPQNGNTSQIIELGNYGGVKEEIEMLKRDKNILMQELIRLKQQQQSTSNQIQTMVKKIQIMGHRQQLMMSFLAKAMQHPGLFAHFVQQQNESSKKRRLSNQESNSSYGQIVKYQPFMDESMTMMLEQKLSSESSPMLKNINNVSDTLVNDIRNVPEVGVREIVHDKLGGITDEDFDSGNISVNDTQNETGIVSPSPILEYMSNVNDIDNAQNEPQVANSELSEEMQESVSGENSEKQDDVIAYLKQIEAELDDFSTPIEDNVDDINCLDIMNELMEDMRFGQGIVSVQSADSEMQHPASSSIRSDNAVNNLAVQMGLLTSDSKG